MSQEYRQNRADSRRAEKRLTGANTELVFGAKPYRKNEIMQSEADIAKLLELGWTPKYDLVTGLKEMIEVETREVI